jgi:hypothetical protein
MRRGYDGRFLNLDRAAENARRNRKIATAW